MAEAATAIPEDRALSAEERAILRFLLTEGDVRARTFEQQIEVSRVRSRCSCGCASVDFIAKPAGGLEQLGDEYFWLGPAGGICAVFAFARDGVLAGLETYSLDAVETPVQLPSLKQLRKEPWGFDGV